LEHWREEESPVEEDHVPAGQGEQEEREEAPMVWL